MSKILKTLFKNSTNKENNLSSKEINRRLEIAQDNERNLNRYRYVKASNI